MQNYLIIVEFETSSCVFRENNKNKVESTPSWTYIRRPEYIPDVHTEQCKNWRNVRTPTIDVIFVILQLTLSTFGTLLKCFYCRVRAGKCLLKRVILRLTYDFHMPVLCWQWEHWKRVWHVFVAYQWSLRTESLTVF